MAVRERLLERDLDGLRSMWADDSNLLSGLVALLSERDDLVRWRAIEALGELGGELALDDPGAARGLVRRQMWNLTEESGNQAWSAPEAIGAMLYHAPVLAREYAVILVHYEEEPIYRPGAMWAFSHLAPRYAELLRGEADLALARVEDESPLVRAHAARALGALGHAGAREALEGRAEDDERILLYGFDSGHLQETSVAEVARAALETLAGQCR